MEHKIHPTTHALLCTPSNALFKLWPDPLPPCPGKRQSLIKDDSKKKKRLWNNRAHISVWSVITQCATDDTHSVAMSQQHWESSSFASSCRGRRLRLHCQSCLRQFHPDWDLDLYHRPDPGTWTHRTTISDNMQKGSRFRFFLHWSAFFFPSDFFLSNERMKSMGKHLICLSKNTHHMKCENTQQRQHCTMGLSTEELFIHTHKIKPWIINWSKINLQASHRQLHWYSNISQPLHSSKCKNKHRQRMRMPVYNCRSHQLKTPNCPQCTAES